MPLRLPPPALNTLEQRSAGFWRSCDVQADEAELYRTPDEVLCDASRHSDLEDMQRTVLAFGAIYDEEGLQLTDDEVEQEFKVCQPI